MKELQARGETLKAGQLSAWVGGFGTLFSLTEAGKTNTVTSKGVPGEPVSTSVRISE
ncbi:MAG: hypothetical protein SD837_05280 [Candidatus Electrothrix scaldis]|nr:MAG: hypothetical protein SD837_05280 [Candidatus Electrothrix sp. GW3-3]